MRGADPIEARCAAVIAAVLVGGCRTGVPGGGYERAHGEIAPDVPVTSAVAPSARAAPASIPGGVTSSAGRIALDDARVYWVDAHANRYPVTNAPSRVLSAPKGGGAPLVLATIPTDASSGIAVDDAFVFVGYVGAIVPPAPCPKDAMCRRLPPVHAPTGAVVAVPKGGGVPRVLVSDARDPRWIVADGQQVYWADGKELSRVPREGGQRTVLLANGMCRALALDATHVYCLRGGISRVPKAGGPEEILVRDEADEMALAVGPTTLYFDGRLDVRRSEPRTGCKCCGVQSAACVEPDPMIDRVPILAAVPKAGGAPTTLVRERVGSPVVLDSRRAYWVAGFRILSVDLAGGEPLQIAGVGPEPPSGGLAVDESRLYWVTEQGELRSAASAEARTIDAAADAEEKERERRALKAILGKDDDWEILREQLAKDRARRDQAGRMQDAGAH